MQRSVKWNENISSNDDGQVLLNDISLSIKSGEILGIAGVSGNGQVELANVICGIERSFEGKVLINAKDVSLKGVRSRKKLNLSYIPENRLGVGLAPGVSVLDNSAIKDILNPVMVLIFQKVKWSII